MDATAARRKRGKEMVLWRTRRTSGARFFEWRGSHNTREVKIGGLAPLSPGCPLFARPLIGTELRVRGATGVTVGPLQLKLRGPAGGYTYLHRYLPALNTGMAISRPLLGTASCSRAADRKATGGPREPCTFDLLPPELRSSLSTCIEAVQ